MFVLHICLLMVSVIELLILFICYQRGKGHWEVHHRHGLRLRLCLRLRFHRLLLLPLLLLHLHHCHHLCTSCGCCLHLCLHLRLRLLQGLWVIFIECLAYAAHTITPNADHVTFRLENGMWIEWLRRSMVKVLTSAVPRLGSCASSGRAWRLWAAWRSNEEASPLSALPLPRLLEPAASKAADFTAVDHPGATPAGSSRAPSC